MPKIFALVIVFSFSLARGQSITPAKTELPDITIQSHEQDLLGLTDSAAAGTVTKPELENRPLLRPADVIESVPGMVTTQHAGGGKANQYYLRGFQLDHGTDFAFYVDGVPLNLPSHAHGQGYTDLNWLIPELVDSVDYKKGVYDPEQGDFGNTGSAQIKLVDKLPESFTQVGGGSLGYGRVLVAGSPVTDSGHWLYGLETETFDGAWTTPDALHKLSAVLKYSSGDERSGYSITGQAYSASWKGTDQVPDRAIVASGNRYASIDPDTGGITDRVSVEGEWHRQDADSLTRVVAYMVHYDLDLYSDFTYWINQAQGDEFRQHDNNRLYTGFRSEHTDYAKWWDRDVDNTLGFQLRQDWVELDLDHVQNRIPFQHVSSNKVTELNLAPWAQNRIHWNPWFRSELGVRLDTYNIGVTSDYPGNSGTSQAAIASPKLSLIFGPWNKTEYYFQAGSGFRSNDARGVFTKTAPEVYNGSAYVAEPSNTQPLLVKSLGAEVGIRSSSITHLKTTLSIWALQNNSDTFFDADSGSLQDIDRPSLRSGIEWTNIYSPLEGLSVDADFASSTAYFTDGDPNHVGKNVPEAVRTVASGAVSIKDYPGWNTWFGSLRFRYIGPRYLVEDGSQQSQQSLVFNLLAGHKINKTWTMTFEALNLFNSKYNDAEYYDKSRLKGETAGPNPDGSWNDHLEHAGDPLMARLFLTAVY